MERYEGKVITFEVSKFFEEKLKTSQLAKGFVNCLTQTKQTEEDFLREVYDKTEENVLFSLSCTIKNTKEINTELAIIDTINAHLSDLESNLRLRQYIYITKDLNVSHRTYLCGNGYFRNIYQISDIQIPDKNYYGYEHEEEWKKDYKNGYLYIIEDTNVTEIDLSHNYDDGIGYTGSYLETIDQVLLNNKVESAQNFVGYVDMLSQDHKINAELNQDDMSDLFLLKHGQERTNRYDNRYEISIEELNGIVKQLEE